MRHDTQLTPHILDSHRFPDSLSVQLLRSFSLSNARMALPAQGNYPDVLYRVTSTMTYYPKTKKSKKKKRRSIVPYLFQVPECYKKGVPLDLSREFGSTRSFATAVQCHILAQSQVTGVGVFNSPFVSFTSSLRYAVSVAMIQEDRDHSDATITVIDCRSLQDHRPIWSAYRLASQYGIHGKNEFADFMDEYLVFDTLQGDEHNSCAVRYSDIKVSFARLMPALDSIRDTSRKRRFSDLMDDVPVEASLPTAHDGDYAFRLATHIAPKSVVLPVMTSLLLFQERELAGDPQLHRAVVDLVASKARDADPVILHHYAVVMAFTDGHRRLKVRDYLGPQYVPAMGSTTLETTDLCHCLFGLRYALHEDQEQIIASSLCQLSTVALVLRKFLVQKGTPDTLIKQCDRGDSTVWAESLLGASDLLSAFVELKQAVRHAVEHSSCTDPLLRLHDCLKEAWGVAKAASQLAVSMHPGQFQMLSSAAGVR